MGVYVGLFTQRTLDIISFYSFSRDLVSIGGTCGACYIVLYCAFYTYAFTLKFAVGAIRSGEGEKGGGLDVCTMRYALLYNIGFIQNLFFFLRIYHKELDIRIVFIPF